MIIRYFANPTTMSQAVIGRDHIACASWVRWNSAKLMEVEGLTVDKVNARPCVIWC